MIPAGRARHQSGTLGGEIADVHGMKSVHIFFRDDRQQDLLGVHLRRQRQLHQDAVDLVAPVQVLDQRRAAPSVVTFPAGVCFSL